MGGIFLCHLARFWIKIYLKNKADDPKNNTITEGPKPTEGPIVDPLIENSEEDPITKNPKKNFIIENH